MEGERLLTNLRLLLLPVFLAGVAGALWYWVFFHFHLHVSKEDDDWWQQMFQFATLFHSLLATGALTLAVAGHMELRRCKRDDNKAGFKARLAERIPLALKILLLVFSFVVMSIALLAPYATAFAGVNMCACVAFMLGVYWEVAINLDDPVNGVWYHGWIDKTWLEP